MGVACAKKCGTIITCDCLFNRLSKSIKSVRRNFHPAVPSDAQRYWEFLGRNVISNLYNAPARAKKKPHGDIRPGLLVSNGG